MSNLGTFVGGVSLSKVLLNSSNPFATSLEDLQNLANSPASGAFATRTACPNFQHDNEKHQWRAWGKDDDGGGGNTINCLGYSCYSFEYYCDAISKVQSSKKKPCFFSISGYADEVATMIQKLGTQFSDAKENPILVEVNLSCPNIPGKPPIAYDFAGMKEYLTTIFANGTFGLVVGVKLTPYFYDGQFVEAAEVLNGCYPNLAFVTSINTVGCGLVVDIESESAVLPATYGGLGGKAVHATALGNVRRLRQLLRPELDIVGCGGVDSGAAAFSHLLCGARAVMVASALLTEGVGVLERIERELLEIMARKGYQSIEEFRGKLNG